MPKSPFSHDGSRRTQDRFATRKLADTRDRLVTQEWTRGEYTISTDRLRLDLDVIHDFLVRSYWAEGRARERVAQAIEHSLPFGVYHGDAQVGFARVVTDYVVLAFLADVFVLEEHRGKGLGAWLVEVVTSLPELRPMRRWLLGTRDAHELYRKFGFSEPTPGVLMERVDHDSDKADSASQGRSFILPELPLRPSR
jgi:GNAT superfamily N-acetyltransferase